MASVSDRLFVLRDEGYKNFHCKLIPTVATDRVIGVRTPVLRKYAKEFIKTKECEPFLRALPHQYYDEDNLHAFVIEGMKDYDRAIALVEDFLPYVDNWATCDMLSPKCFRNHLTELYERIRVWLESGRTYVVRFGIDMLMKYYLEDNNFDKEHLKLVASVDSEEYYISMAVAWYFATAMAKQRETTLPFVENHRLMYDTHQRMIQKCIESYRISKEDKEYLRIMKVKNKNEYIRNID